MAVREGIGKIGKSAPKVDDPAIQRALDTVYKDINKVSDGANNPSGTSSAKTHLGSSGDIKLYKGHGSDGSTGYFLQARFEDGWATTRLTLQAKNPEATEAVHDESGFGIDDGAFITIKDVTFESLAYNNDIASQIGDAGLSTLVARGDHKHNHWVLQNPIQLDQDDYNTGVVTIDDPTHINNIHFPLAPDSHGGSATMVSGDPGDTGDQDVAARWDHTHKLNTGYAYTWTENQTIGTAGAGKTLFINGPTTGSGSNALEVSGDMELDGNLTVGYAETQPNHVDLERNVKLNTDNLNTAGNANEDYDNTTIVHGPTKFTAGLSVKRSIISDGVSDDKYHYDATDHVDGIPPVVFQDNSDTGQLRIAYNESNYFDFKVDTSGNLLLEAKGNIQLKPNIENVDTEEGYVLPKGNLLTHLGDIDRQFASIHAGELVVQNIMAMNIQSTIGGQLRVAPTSKLSDDLASGTTDYIYFEHDDPNFRNAWVFLQKSELSGSDESTGEYDYIVGDVQFEAIRTKDIAPVSVGTADAPSYKYEIHTRNGDGTGANAWKAKDAAVVLYNLGNNKSKGFIEITSTGSVFNTYGPRISLNAAKDGDTTWNAAKKIITIGNLRSLADYNASDDDNFGMILSDDCTESTTNMKGLTFDQQDGIRLWNTPLNIYSGGTKKVEIFKDGSMRLGSDLQILGDGVGETVSDWDTNNSNIGLSWSGSELIVNGILYVEGDLLSAELESLQNADTNLQDQINDIPNLDNLSNYQAAELISQAFPGNIVGDDWDMEFEPAPASDYTDMQLWYTHTPSQVEKNTTIVYNGSHSMRIESIHSQSHSPTVVYLADLQNERRRFPVVPGMKFTGKYWYYIPESTWTDGVPPIGHIKWGLKFFGQVPEEQYTWKSFCPSASATDSWHEATGTYTVPSNLTWYDHDQDGFSISGEPKYVEPYLVVDENDDSENDADSSLYAYLDEVILMMDSSLALPASPSGNPGFFAGSDAFGVHDGNYWRTYFGLNANGSVMKLTNAEGDDLVTWDNDIFSIGDKIKLQSDGNVKIEGDLKIGDSGSIYSNEGGFAQDGVFLGHTYDGQHEHPKMSLVKAAANSDDDIKFIFDSQNQSLAIENANINVKNGDIKVDNNDVDVIIGQDIANQDNNDHDDVLIGTWDDQKASSPSGQGILVKHDTLRNEDADDGAGSNKYDYSKLDQNGFNRAGFEYPIFIGAVSECPGWAGKTDSNTTWQGQKGNKIFDNYNGQKIYYPGTEELYNKVPPGRALFLQVTSAAMCNNSNASQGPWPAIFETGYRDGSGEDSKSQRASFGPIFYRATDWYQVNTLKYQSSPPNENSKLHNLGTLFNSSTEYGPWNSFIPENTEVSDLRVCNFFIQPRSASKFQIDVMWVNVMIWEVSMSNVPAESVFYSNTDPFDHFPWGFSMTSGGGNPF